MIYSYDLEYKRSTIYYVSFQYLRYMSHFSSKTRLDDRKTDLTTQQLIRTLSNVNIQSTGRHKAD